MICAEKEDRSRKPGVRMKATNLVLSFQPLRPLRPLRLRVKSSAPYLHECCRAIEDWASVLALSVMSLLPLIAMASRRLGVRGIPGSTIFVQHLTLWVALLGAALAARSERLLSLSTTAFLPERWQPRAKVFSAAIAAAISLCLAWASLSFVRV